MREQVDPRAQRAWQARFGVGAPFGNLRRLFREEHCAALNPYDSTFCAYPTESCGLAFLQCVYVTVERARDGRTAVGYFRYVARSLGAQRADTKPLARDQHEAQAQVRSGDPRPAISSPDPRPDPGDIADRDDEDEPMRRRISTPQHIGSLLGAFNFGSRQRPADDGQASPLR